MKATFRNLGLAIVAILMAVSFSACSDNSDGDLVGTWKVSYSEPGYSQNLTLTFKSNGSFTMTSKAVEDGETYNDSAKGTYTTSGDNLILHVTWDSDDYAPYDVYFKYILDGDKLSLCEKEEGEYSEYWLTLTRK